MTVKTDPRFWDCECSSSFQHRATPDASGSCKSCGAEEATQPDSRVDELNYAELGVDP